MPQLPYQPEQAFLLPPDIDEWISADHPFRFLRAMLEGMTPAEWAELGIELEPAGLGRPRYAPIVLLGAWVGGFMSGIRSTRKIEQACREQLPFRYLTAGQTPDHNTLSRFYVAHRSGMQALLRQTVQVAVQLQLIDWAVQAVDGTKIRANARGHRSLRSEELAALTVATEAAIAELEAQQEGNDDPPPPALPAALRSQQVLRERLAAAQAAVQEAPRRVNLTDPEARTMRTEQGMRPAYNAQAVVVAVAPPGSAYRSRLVVAADVATCGNDNHLLPDMLTAARVAGAPQTVTVADAGYHSGETLAACRHLGATVVMPESRERRWNGDYAKERFVYDGTTDTYVCPAGHSLRRAGQTTMKGVPGWRYQGSATVCQACPAWGVCTTNRDRGRTIWHGAHAADLAAHRAWMASPAAQSFGQRRKSLIEPVFGILKEQLGARQWLTRGHDKVKAEWALLAVAFNLRTLAKALVGTGLNPTHA